MAEGTARPARIVFGAETRKLRRDLAAAKGEIRGFGKDTAHSIRSSIGTAFAGAFSLASLGGAVAVVKDVVANEQALTRLGIQAEVSDERVRALSNNLFQISDSTGQFRSELIAGATELVTLTGDFKLAAQSASALGVAATATGASMQDLAGVSAALSQNMGIAGRSIGGALDILAVQGKQGAVELKDLASLLPTASAGFKKFGEDGQRGVAVLGAALQVSKTATGTASEAATAFNALGKSLVANATRIKKLSGGKVKVFERDEHGRKVARDFVAILEDLRKSKLARDPEALQKALGTEEAVKSFQALSDNWKMFQKLTTAGLEGGGTIAADFKRYIESPAGRMERAWTRASNALQRAVTPERVELLARATEKFAQGLGFAVDHAGQLVALFASIKVGQFALATNKWSTALAGVAGQAGSVNTRLGSAAGSLQGMTARSATLVSRVGSIAGAAGGIASAFTSSFTATSALLDALGVFEDKYKTVATADDPDQKASQSQMMLANVDNEIASLEQRRSERVREMAWKGAAPGAAERDPEIARIDRQLWLAHRNRETQEEDFRATTFLERDRARGSDAAPAVFDELRNQQILEQYPAPMTPPSVLALPEVIPGALERFAPELQGLAGEKLDRVIGLLELSLREQERSRILNERVALKAESFREPPARAPRTGTTPR
jgi:TP901 family phage tail tape measure protein